MLDVQGFQSYHSAIWNVKCCVTLTCPVQSCVVEETASTGRARSHKEPDIRPTGRDVQIES